MDVKPMNLKSTETIQQLTNSPKQTMAAQTVKTSVREAAPVLGDGAPSESAQMLQEVLQISDTLNRKVKFSIDTDSNRVIVRIVDKETNEVIRELPPEALVKLHKKMKEAMGILGVFVDQKA